MEMSLPPKVNIRFDLILILPAVISQALVIATGWYNLRSAKNF
jgi:hypothetical protein